MKIERQDEGGGAPSGALVEPLPLLETAATASWLFMDLFWMLGAITLATSLGSLALALQLGVFRYVPRRLAERAANGAVCGWVLMNLLWMLGEEYEVRGMTHAAVGVFALSIVLLVVAVKAGGLHGPVLRWFRRFRFLRIGP